MIKLVMEKTCTDMKNSHKADSRRRLNDDDRNDDDDKANVTLGPVGASSVLILLGPW